MKKRYVSYLAAALAGVLAVGCLAGCGKKDTAGKGDLTTVTLNEVAHSIFYAPQYVAIEKGYFKEEADIGFMGSEASIYVYSQNPDDYIVNFAQLTQRAGNFLVAREPADDFQWADLKGKNVLGGRKGGMPQMVFEYILNTN